MVHKVDGWPVASALLLLLLLIGAKVSCAVRSSTQPPNFVIILTDDQDVVLNGMVPMSITHKLLANAGVTFNNAFTTSPLCCPSRATLLTGQYVHNHQTINNSLSGGCYATHWRHSVEPTATLPVYFQRRGYQTFYAGKYLNRYTANAVPAGWSQWFGLHGNSRYRNFTLTENGVRRSYTNGEYLTDVLADLASQFVRNQTAQEPFVALVAPPSAHAPFEPAERHSGRFADVPLLQTGSFNRASGKLDKHWLLSGQRPAKLSADSIERLRYINVQRWRTLLAVDEMVGEIVGALAERQLLDNTYVLYTSDNGFHLGQFALAAGKRMPYETDIRVPLLVRGPGVPAKRTVDGVVALVDVLPTLLDLAGIEKPYHLDGVSFAGQLLQPNGGDGGVVDRQVLVEYWGEGDARTFEPQCGYVVADNMMGCDAKFDCHCEDTRNNSYVCLRQSNADENLLYCEFDDAEEFAEAYDLNADPDQLHNLAFDMLPSQRTQYSLALGKLAKCVGRGCQQIY